jgi:putative ABC transport system permease protein
MKHFSLVVTELWRRKSRLLSGLLAITLGIGVIVGIQSVTKFSEKAVAVKLDNLGANILVLPQAASIDDYYAADIDAPTFDQAYVERIVSSALPGVDNLSPKLTRRVHIGAQVAVLTGILPASEIAAKPLWQTAGLTAAELKATCAASPSRRASTGYEDPRLQRKAINSLSESECFLGSAIARRLAMNEGDTLIIERRSFSVTKVLPETGTIDDDRIFAHLNSVQQMLGIRNQISAIEIMGCCAAISDGLLGKLRNILPDTRITTIGQIVATQTETNALMNKLSLAIFVIILVVGGISIGNIIWANVVERKKEIGILRMLGFSNASISVMFITKAALLGLFGGLLGYALGTTAAVVLGPNIIGIDVPPLVSLLPLSVGLAMGIAGIGALWPAWLATRIDPYTNMQET